MPIENIPEIYSQDKEFNTGLFVYDFKMTNNVAKVNLSMNMFIFLQVGKKQVHLQILQ
jgi:hypothetical protein